MTSDHDKQDAEVRKAIEPQVRLTIIAPDIIIKDADGRYLYYRVIVLCHKEEMLKVKILKVVTESDMTPSGAVTWTPIRKGDDINNGVIIYERRGNELSADKI